MLHQAGLILALASAADAPAAPVVPPTTVAPVTDATYADVVQKPRAGKVVLVDFWATYCAPCINELPGLVALRDKMKAAGGDVVFVNVDPPEKTDARLQKTLQKHNVALGATLQVKNEDAQPFIEAVSRGLKDAPGGMTSWSGEVPFGVLYGRDGKVAAVLSGERKIEDIEALVTAALAKGKKP